MLSSLQANSACCDGVYRTPAHVLALMPCAEGKTKPVAHYLEVLSNLPFRKDIGMNDIDLLDDEYCTPAQRAELRKLKAELPLWAEFAQPATQGAIEPETTIDAAQVQTDVEAPADVSSGFSADTISAAKMLMSVLADTPSDVTAQLLADIAAHRALNGTTGMESEE